eukprot:TRINITY_DN23017_c0_g1_i1.p1 TRINITY_DN23017_c0_g1~~TRINITY_DN23017_c0_g1_i1.p1  ORF type:complete len:181 (-),score=43.67 TRINITY_DN23017_c0_g1_i1:52-594(-)
MSKATKIIIIGDSAVGKTKLVERFLKDKYTSVTSSTYGVNIQSFQSFTSDGKPCEIEFWDTAGQSPAELHSTFYDRAFACILVFDITRKETYTHLNDWFNELMEFRKGVPCVLIANKVDADPEVMSKTFNFGAKRGFSTHFTSASENTNIGKPFQEAIDLAVKCKANPPEDFLDDVLDML